MSAATLKEVKEKYNFKEIKIADWRDPKRSVLPARGRRSSDEAGKPHIPKYNVKYHLLPDPTDDEDSDKDGEDPHPNPEASIDSLLERFAEHIPSEEANNPGPESNTKGGEEADDAPPAVAEVEETPTEPVAEANEAPKGEPAALEDPEVTPVEPKETESDVEQNMEHPKDFLSNDRHDEKLLDDMDAKNTKATDSADRSATENICPPPEAPRAMDTEEIDAQLSADTHAEEHNDDRRVSFAPGTPEPKPTVRKKKSATASKKKKKRINVAMVSLPPEVMAMVDGTFDDLPAPPPSEPPPSLEDIAPEEDVGINESCLEESTDTPGLGDESEDGSPTKATEEAVEEEQTTDEDPASSDPAAQEHEDESVVAEISKEEPLAGATAAEVEIVKTAATEVSGFDFDFSSAPPPPINILAAGKSAKKKKSKNKSPKSTSMLPPPAGLGIDIGAVPDIDNILKDLPPPTLSDVPDAPAEAAVEESPEAITVESPNDAGIESSTENENATPARAEYENSPAAAEVVKSEDPQPISSDVKDAELPVRSGEDHDESAIEVSESVENNEVSAASYLPGQIDAATENDTDATKEARGVPSSTKKPAMTSGELEVQNHIPVEAETSPPDSGVEFEDNVSKEDTSKFDDMSETEDTAEGVVDNSLDGVSVEDTQSAASEQMEDIPGSEDIADASENAAPEAATAQSVPEENATEEVGNVEDSEEGSKVANRLSAADDSPGPAPNVSLGKDHRGDLAADGTASKEEDEPLPATNSEDASSPIEADTQASDASRGVLEDETASLAAEEGNDESTAATDATPPVQDTEGVAIDVPSDETSVDDAPQADGAPTKETAPMEETPWTEDQATAKEPPLIEEPVSTEICTLVEEPALLKEPGGTAESPEPLLDSATADDDVPIGDAPQDESVPEVDAVEQPQLKDATATDSTQPAGEVAPEEEPVAAAPPSPNLSKSSSHGSQTSKADHWERKHADSALKDVFEDKKVLQRPHGSKGVDVRVKDRARRSRRRSLDGEEEAQRKRRALREATRLVENERRKLEELEDERRQLEEGKARRVRREEKRAARKAEEEAEEKNRHAGDEAEVVFKKEGEGRRRRHRDNGRESARSPRETKPAFPGPTLPILSKGFNFANGESVHGAPLVRTFSGGYRPAKEPSPPTSSRPKGQSSSKEQAQELPIGESSTKAPSSSGDKSAHRRRHHHHRIDSDQPSRNHRNSDHEVRRPTMEERPRSWLGSLMRGL